MLSLTHQNLINNLYLVYIIYLNIANIARLLRKFGVLVNVCGFFVDNAASGRVVFFLRFINNI